MSGIMSEMNVAHNVARNRQLVYEWLKGDGGAASGGTRLSAYPSPNSKACSLKPARRLRGEVSPLADSLQLINIFFGFMGKRGRVGEGG